MKDGKIDQMGSPTEIYRCPRTRFVADFIGRANFVDAQVLERHDGHLIVSALGGQLTVPAPADLGQAGLSVTLMVRPEAIEIADEDAGAPLHGIVQRSAYLGNVIEYDLEVAGRLLAVIERDPRRATIHSEGETVPVRLLEDCLYVMRDIP